MRALFTFSRMSEALAVQINGLGRSLWRSTYRSMAVINSWSCRREPLTKSRRFHTGARQSEALRRKHGFVGVRRADAGGKASSGVASRGAVHTGSAYVVAVVCRHLSI
jgi:hypothetical protein